MFFTPERDPKSLAHFPGFLGKGLLDHTPWCLICGHGGTPYPPRFGMETFCDQFAQSPLYALPVEPSCKCSVYVAHPGYI